MITSQLNTLALPGLVSQVQQYIAHPYLRIYLIGVTHIVLRISLFAPQFLLEAYLCY